MKPDILVIDNYDSFTYNLVQALGKLGARIEVRRNDAMNIDDIESLDPARILVSPGPCGPAEAGVSVDVIRRFAARKPLLGVCLGHQCIGATFGAEVVRAGEVMHGKTSLVTHDGKGIFANLPSPLEAMRYHSLVVDPDTLPLELEISARTQDGVVMGLRYREDGTALEGVQFHPESFLTEAGEKLLDNFLKTGP